MGCEGRRDPKLKITGGLRVGLRFPEPLTPPGGTGEMIERVVRRAQHAPVTAVQTMDVAAIERAAGMIGQARTLCVFGSAGASSWRVEEVRNRLFRAAQR